MVIFNSYVSHYQRVTIQIEKKMADSPDDPWRFLMPTIHPGMRLAHPG